MSRRSALSYALIVLAVLIALVCLFIVVSLVTAGAAVAASTEQAVFEMLRDFGSPLADEAYTVVAHRRTQGPEADILPIYAVAWAETNLARDSFWRRTFNLGCIRGGPEGSPWRDWRVGTYKGFNMYDSPRMGQRALLRLLWERNYMPLLAAHDWRGFTKRYWGGDYYKYPSKREGYIADLAAAYRLLVQSGRKHGLAAVHLNAQ